MPTYNTTADTGSLEELAKESYPQNEIKKLEQLETAFLQEVEETRELTFSAKNDGSFIFPTMAYGAHGQKMKNEKEAVPFGKPSGVVNGASFIKEYCGVIEFTKRELELAKNNKVAFANAKTFEMDSLITNAGKYFNRQIANGDGSGLMTLVSGAQVTQTQIEVDDATPFQIGMVIDIFDSTGVTKQVDAAVVQDIDILSTPNSITLDGGPFSCDDDGQIFLAGVNDNASADGKEMIGIPLVCDDGSLAASFQDIIRTGAGETPNYRGISINVSGPLSEAVIGQLFSRAMRMGAGDFTKFKDSYWLMSPEQWRMAVALGIGQIQFTDPKSVDTSAAYGNSERTLAGKRVVIDTDVARDRAFLCRKNALKMAVATPLDWESDLGGTTLKHVPGYTQGIMLLYALQQLYAEDVKGVVCLDNLTVPGI